MVDENRRPIKDNLKIKKIKDKKYQKKMIIISRNGYLY